MKNNIFREIPNFEGRYLIDLEGRIIDTNPYFFNEWRFIETSRGRVGLMKEGKQRTYYIVNLIKSTFPEVSISDDELNEIKQRVEYQDSITLDIDTFNKFIFPNKIIKIFDKTWNKTHKKKDWKKPSPVTIRNGKILIKKNHIYFGYGTRGLIYIKSNCLPYNGKQFEEHPSKQTMRNQNALKKKKEIHHTELWQD